MTTEKIAEQIRFAYWVPNVSGGLVTNDIEQRTGWDFEYNKKLAQTAENNGFDYALSQVRYTASYGATERLKVFAAIHPGLWHPAVLAKFGATADHLSNAASPSTSYPVGSQANSRRSASPGWSTTNSGHCPWCTHGGNGIRAYLESLLPRRRCSPKGRERGFRGAVRSGWNPQRYSGSEPAPFLAQRPHAHPARSHPVEVPAHRPSVAA
jgi:hypothetical protein